MMKGLAKYLPILHWSRTYQRQYIKSDITAGLTTAVMLIPQAMAYAMLAGLPPMIGLYGAIAPLLIYAIFGSSRQMAIGPVAIISLMTGAAISSVTETGSESYMLLAVTLALMVGIIQFLLGVLRFGFIVNLLSHPVISGFTSAAAIIIAFSQLKHVFGIDIPRSQNILEISSNIISQLDTTNLYTMLIAAICIYIILRIKRWNAFFPGALTVVVLSTFSVWFFQLDQFGVKIIGTVPEGLPSPGIPELDTTVISSLIPAAIAIAMISFIESVSVAKAFARKNRYSINANQELVGIGLANITSSLFKAFPVAGGFSRTAVNAQAGAKTNLATIITALVVACVLAFLTPLFYYLPKAVLAAIILTAVFTLVDIKEVKHLYKVKQSDLALLLLTFFSTLVIGIEEGVLIGIGLSLLWFVIRTTIPHAAVLGRLPGTQTYRNISRFPEAIIDESVTILRVDAQFYFGNSQFLKELIEKQVRKNKDKIKAIVIEAASINQLDSSASSTLCEIQEDLKNNNIQLYFANVKGPVMDVMEKSGFYKLLGVDHFFIDLHSAVTSARKF